MSEPEAAEAPLAGPLSIPNAITVVRLALLPYFAWLALHDHRYVAAGWLLGLLGATDYLDGWIARRFAQTSTLGKILDPVADRLLAITSVVVLWASHAAPRWLLVVVVLREVLVSVATVLLAALGAARIDVLWVGKTGTFALMCSFPWFLFGTASGTIGDVMYVAAYATGLIGMVLGWVALGSYVRPALDALSRGRSGRSKATLG